ncbi:hypothetical protein PGB90_005228 [Kerria lacca]
MIALLTPLLSVNVLVFLLAWLLFCFIVSNSPYVKSFLGIGFVHALAGKWKARYASS